MFSTLRNRFGIPGVISVIALVFAMFGGAYAASNSSGGGKATASAKAKKGPRGPKGATGPAGPVGPAGLAGAKGDAGVVGSNGTNGSPGSAGAPGKSVKSSSFEGTDEPAGEPCEEHGGVQFEAEGSGVKKYACNGANGANGSPWTAGGTLPAGSTETGAWGMSGPSTCVEAGKCTSYNFLGPTASISFTVPLAAPIEVAQAIYVSASAPNPDPTHCPGSPDNPEALSGYLCVYAGSEGGATLPTPIFVSPGSGFAAGKSGSSIFFLGMDTSTHPPFAYGSWAVTG